MNQPGTNITTKSQKPGSYIAAAAVLAFIGVILYFYFSNNVTDSARSKAYSLPDTSEINLAVVPPGKTSQPELPNITEKELSATSSSETDNGMAPDSDRAPAENPVSPGYSAGPVIEDLSGNSAKSPPASEAGAAVEAVDSHLQEDATSDTFYRFLRNLNSRHSRNTAILQTLKLWGPTGSINSQAEIIENDPVFFRKAAEDNGFLVQSIATENDLEILETLNLPAVLTFYLPNQAWPKYLTIAGLDGEYAYFDAGDQGGITVVDRKTLLKYWSGEAFIVWKNFMQLDGMITQHSSPESLQSLKLLLSALSYQINPNNITYDDATIQVIKEIQRKNGLEVDGIVGPFTKIALYNESSEFLKPALGKFKVSQPENGN